VTPSAAKPLSQATSTPADAQAITEIVDRARPRLAAILASYEIPPEDAEDIVQDSLLALMLRWAATHAPEDYLVGILRHKCAAYIRGRYEERQILRVDRDTLEVLVGGGPPMQEALARRIDLAAISGRLSIRQCCVFVLRWFGFTHREIGAACGRPTDTVRRDAARAIDKLQATGKGAEANPAA
jgi:RNA polymerase sigma factor (sigma-70 family)